MASWAAGPLKAHWFAVFGAFFEMAATGIPSSWAELPIQCFICVGVLCKDSMDRGLRQSRRVDLLNTAGTALSRDLLIAHCSNVDPIV